MLLIRGGHGRSDGKRGHVDQFQYYINDLTELIHIARDEQKVNKISLLGTLSVGVIALQYALEGFKPGILRWFDFKFS